MRSFIKFIVTGVFALSLTGCKEEKKEASFKHPDFGIVTANNPKYLEVHSLCDERIYGKGFEINGEIYTSKADVFEQIQPILSKTNKTKDDIDILTRWSGVAQTNFIMCITEQGFVFVRD